MFNFVVALPCEATPIIQHYGLKKITDRAYKIYAKDPVYLIISGIGKTAAAAATAYLHALQHSTLYPAWLNVGIAGHQSLDIGEIFLAHKITEHSTNKTFHPEVAFSPPCEISDLITTDHAESEYPLAVAYDMEASGYFSAATRFTIPELIHSTKIISDNETNLAETITKSGVSELINARLETIDAIKKLLESLASEAKSLNDDAGPKELHPISRK